MWRGLLIACFLFAAHNACGGDEPETRSGKKPRVAVITTVYFHNSHADMFASRMLQGYTLDGKGEFPHIELASLYLDQIHPRDVGRELARQHDVPVYKTIEEALTLGTGELAVDGVFLVAEHGDYPESDTGQFIFPKRRFFAEVARVFEKSGRVVPLFFDKHLADNWEDGKWIYDEIRRLKIPAIAGSSLPLVWRDPPAEVKPGTKLKEVLAFSYGRLDSYGFHTLEAIQSLVERRAGGETGIRSVRVYRGDDVWAAGKRGVWDREVMEAALARLKERPLPEGKQLEDLAKNPTLVSLDYRDGLRANVMIVAPPVVEWSTAWRTADGEVGSTLFRTQELRPFMHFSHFFQEVEKVMHGEPPAWPLERTLLTTGALDAMHLAHKQGGKVETPQLRIRYESEWRFRQPPPPPPGRPITEQ